MRKKAQRKIAVLGGLLFSFWGTARAIEICPFTGIEDPKIALIGFVQNDDTHFIRHPGEKPNEIYLSTADIRHLYSINVKSVLKGEYDRSEFKLTLSGGISFHSDYSTLFSGKQYLLFLNPLENDENLELTCAIDLSEEEGIHKLRIVERVFQRSPYPLEPVQLSFWVESLGRSIQQLAADKLITDSAFAEELLTTTERAKKSLLDRNDSTHCEVLMDNLKEEILEEFAHYDTRITSKAFSTLTTDILYIRGLLPNFMRNFRYR